MTSIYYFSGTGTTKYLARLLSHALDAPAYSMENHKINKDDLSIIMYPVYAFTSPSYVDKWVKNIPKGHGKVAIINTSGGLSHLNDGSSYKLIAMLSDKGYDVCYDRNVVIASNYFADNDIGTVQTLSEVAKEKVDDIVSDLYSNRRRIKTYPIKGKVSRVIGHLEHFGARLFGNTLKVRSCNTCMVCVLNCPKDNIVFSEGIKFKSKCMMCMRCVYNCPVNGIYSRGMNWVILKDGYNLKKIQDMPKVDMSKSAKENYKAYIEDKRR